MEIKRLKFMDKTFVITLLIILIFGLVVLTSASSSISSDPHFYLKKQIFSIALGIIAIIIILRYEYVELRRYSWFLYGFSVFY